MRDEQDLIIEDFGLPLNLLLACSVIILKDASEAVARTKVFATFPPSSTLP